MNTTVDYKVLSDAVIADLAVLVQAEIADGWKPVGGIMYDGSSDYSQAMVYETYSPDIALNVTDYTMVHANDATVFITEVKAAIAAGWLLYGGQQGTGVGGFQQAFIKL